jgi:hypothetical protein
MKRILFILAAVLLSVTACTKNADDSADESAENTEQAEQSAESGEAEESGESEEGADDKAAEDDDDQADDGVTADTDVQSRDILDREEVAESAKVKHVLISWDEKSSIYQNRGGQDERGAERTKTEANRLALDLLDRASGEDAEEFDALMEEYSEDKGSARTGREYPVTPDAGLVENFKQLSLRLEEGEVGIVESIFGYHIIKRVE